MPSPRLRSFGLAIGAALIFTLALRSALRCAGEALVPLLHRGSTMEALRLLRGLLLPALAVLSAVFLWRRVATNRSGKVLAFAAAIGALTTSYALSGSPSTRGDFHGLLTPAPNSSFIESTPSRPPVRYQINAHGFRGPDFSLKKAPSTFRIALIGGSFVFGAGVEQDQTLSSALAAALASRSPDRRIEVLNLGLSGNTFPSHVVEVEIAESVLDADLSVLCVLLPAELSRWDGQRERRAPLHVDAPSLVSWALGMQTARFLWSLNEDERGYAGARLRVLAEELATLRASRREHGERPLFVLGYEQIPEEVGARFTALPGVTLLPSPPRRDGLAIPGDGHPSAEGNRVLAAMIAEGLRDDLLLESRKIDR